MHCPYIEEINLGFSFVSSESVKYFSKNENGTPICTKLKKLKIEYSIISDDDVKYLLQNLPSLEIIVYHNLPKVLYSMYKDDLSSLAEVKSYNITVLDMLYCTEIDDCDIREACLSVCPHLKTLSMRLIKDDKINVLPKLPDLEQLHVIGGASNSAHNIDKLLKSVCGKLTSLTITNCTISLSVLGESCPHIKELKLNNIHFRMDNDYKPIFNSLSSLIFYNCKISKNIRAIYLLLISSGKLESLAFNWCTLKSRAIKAHILKCCELNPVRTLSLESCLVKEKFVKDILLNCSALKFINIRNSFSREDEYELLEIAAVLPNKPKLDINDHMDYSDTDSEDLFDDDSDDFDNENYY